MPKSPPKPKKLTKKQMEEELKRQKEEEKKKKAEELRLKHEEEARQRAIEEEKQRIEAEKRRAEEEIIRLENEEKALEPWKNTHENHLQGAYDRIISKEDWGKFSQCEQGYFNVRNEKQLNGFICEFKDKCDNCFINNFKLIEKNFDEEMLLFDYSQLHYQNLERLLFQGKATLQFNQVNYALKFMNAIKDVEKMKIESFTRYFIENFEQLKTKRNDEMGKGNVDKEEKPEIFWEWSNTTGMIKLGFWANNLVQNNAYRAVSTKFKNIPIFVNEFHKSFITKYSIVRFFWCKNDIREYIYEQTGIEAFTPYMSISGCFILDELVYPAKAQLKGTWEIREMVSERYKPSEGLEGGFTKNVKMRYKIDISPKKYLKDINNVVVGLYDQSTGKWNIESEVTLKKQERVVILNTTELGILSVLLERKINFPFKSWYLRCIKKNDQLLAILDLETPRTNFAFELGVSDPDCSDTVKRVDPVKAYVKLINNTEPEFEHLANKEMTFDQIVLELKECGILISPWKEDIIEAGLREKEAITTDRAIEDIVMNCRYYAIRSHEYNALLSPDIIAVKSKPNPDFDNKFFDDEPKDWSDFAWFSNKASIGNFTLENESSVIFKPSIETTRPHLHLIIKDIQPLEVYDQVAEDDFSAAFLVNIRNFIRILGLVHMP